MKFLPEPREEKTEFLLATVQGPHQAPGNTSSIFHSSCHWGRIFSWFLPLQVCVLHSIHSASCSGQSNDIYSSWAIPGEENNGLKLRSYFADPCVLNFLEWQKTISGSTSCCLSSLTKLSDWEGKLVQRKMPRDNSHDLCQDHVWQMGVECYWQWRTGVGELELKLGVQYGILGGMLCAVPPVLSALWMDAVFLLAEKQSSGLARRSVFAWQNGSVRAAAAESGSNECCRFWWCWARLATTTETLSCSRHWTDRDKRRRYAEHHASPLKIFAVLNIEGTVRTGHSNVLELGDMWEVTLSIPNPSPCPLCVLKQANHAPGRAYFQVRKDCVLQFCLLTYCLSRDCKMSLCHL